MQDPEGKYEALTRYARDLTAAARDGKLDPVIGRDDEIRRCIQILSRRTKNNPVLIGEPGVGKTAVAEGASVLILTIRPHLLIRLEGPAPPPEEELRQGTSAGSLINRVKAHCACVENINAKHGHAYMQGWHSGSAPGMFPPPCRTGS